MKNLSFLLAVIVLTSLSVAKADQALVDLVKKVKPCVVLIETFDKDNNPLSQGSGFFINKDRLITNHHVINGAYSATIKTSTGKEYPVLGIVAKDTEADIVKLMVKMPDSNMTFLNLSVNVPSEGEDVVVIGNPLGLESTISTGIVSAVRDIPAFGKILQITAPISPGSSGSPVVNSKGAVIGIATLVITAGQNLNFAVPSDKIIALKETVKVALSESDISLTADENDAQSFYDKGLIELWQENWSAALPCFQKAAEKNPDNALAWFQAGYCYGELGCWQEAIEVFKQAVRINPDYAEAHYNLGNAYFNLSRYQEAIEAFKQAIRITPKDVEAHYNLGITYSSLSRYQEAIEFYKQAIRIKPDYDKAYCNLGNAYSSLSRYQEAIEACKQAIRINPDYAGAYYNLGNAYSCLSRYREAIDACKQAIRINPDYAEAHYNLGNAYSNLSRYQEAIEVFKQAIRIKPDYDKAYCNLGNAYSSLSRYQEAIEVFKQAIRINPDYAEAHYNLGLTYLMNDNKGSALEEYKILKTLDTEIANKLFNLIYR